MKKNFLVMTSLGPVPLEAVEKYLPKEVVDMAVKESTDPLLNSPDRESFYIGLIADRKKWPFKKVASYIDNLEKFSPMAAFSILLREIAVFLDHQYQDSIDKVSEFYYISSFDGKIHKTKADRVKNFKNFAAFRTPDDARFAHRVLASRIRSMFKGSGK